MQLSENFIQKLQSLAGILNENRIEKLIAQKFPEQYLEFVTDFAEQTTKNSNDRSLVLQNKYIPWIAECIKRNEYIVKEIGKLKTIILWIRNSGYNKINTNESFESVYEKAKNWLEHKQTNSETGERISGGKIIKKYNNGYHWIEATDPNFCMSIGEVYGWCFNTIAKSGEFLGLGDINSSNKGYFLLDDKYNPVIAMQYNSKDNIVTDIQGTYNTSLNNNLLPYAIDIFKIFPLIKDITGHKLSFWDSFNFPGNENSIHSLLALPNFKMSIRDKSIRKVPLTKEELDSLNSFEKIEYNIPLTQEEILKLPVSVKIKHRYELTDEELSKLPIDIKLEHGLRMTEKELMSLPVHIKVERGIPLTKKDLSVVNQPIFKRLQKVLKNFVNPKDLFIPDDFKGFKDYDITDDEIKIDMEEEEFEEKFSGVEEYYRPFLHTKYDDSSAIDDEESELEYMSNYLNDTNIEKLKEIAIMLGVQNNYDFDEQGKIIEFIEEYLDNSEDVKDAYIINLDDAYSDARKISVEEALKEQKFKYENGYLVLPYKELYDFLKSHPEVMKFKELQNLEINGEIDDLEDAYYNYNEHISDKDLKNLNDSVLYELEKSEEIILNNLGYSQNINEIHQILNSLKFIQGDFSMDWPRPNNKTLYKLERPQFRYYIISFDFESRTAFSDIFYFKDKKNKTIEKHLQGRVKFENIVNYVNNYSLFEENKLRAFIRNLISEDFKYQYDNANNGFVPTREVIQTAQNAINAVNNNKLVQSDGSNEGSGLQKANSLISGQQVSHAQLKRMKSFFDNNLEAVKKEVSLGKNINNSPIIQKWNLWGGDAAKMWVEKNIGATQSSNQTSKKIRNSDTIARNNKVLSTTNTRIKR